VPVELKCRPVVQEHISSGARNAKTEKPPTLKKRCPRPILIVIQDVIVVSGERVEFHKDGVLRQPFVGVLQAGLLSNILSIRVLGKYRASIEQEK
jgi:hypothetical protein